MVYKYRIKADIFLFGKYLRTETFRTTATSEKSAINNIRYQACALLRYQAKSSIKVKPLEVDYVQIGQS